MEENAGQQQNSFVLVVEDNEAQQRTLVDLMKLEGFEVVGCSTAAEATEQFSRMNTGVVVLDLNLPDHSGTELLQRLSVDSNMIRVIIHTGYSSYESAKDALNLGAFAYVEKADDPEVLLRHVHRAFEESLRLYTDTLQKEVSKRTGELRETNRVLQQEIAERKQGEEKLRESEEKFRGLVESSSDWIWEVNAEGVYTYASPQVEAMLGYKPEEVVGKTPFDLLPADEAERIGEVCKAMGARSEPMVALENVCLHKDGRRVVLETSGVSILDESGKVTGYRGVDRDITERKRAEENLKQEALMRGRLLDNLPCIAMILKKGTREIVACNETARQAGAVPGKTCYEMCAQRDDPCSFCRAPELWATNEPKRLEVEYRGTYYEGIWVPLTEDLYVHYLFDITDRKEASEQLLSYQERLRSLASELFLAEERQRRQIATDLHDSTSQVLAFALTKLQHIHETASGDNLESLSDVCGMVSKVVGDMRSMTFDICSPTLYRFGLETAVSELLDDKFTMRDEINYSFRDDSKAKPLSEDIKIVLFQSIRELVNNIIKHARACNVEVDIQRRENTIRITVNDDGVGFNVEELKLPERSRGGFGLFSIAERLRYIGGSFEFQAQPGCGSSFTLEAPLEADAILCKGEEHGGEDINC